jgi:NADPH:quinone reductase
MEMVKTIVIKKTGTPDVLCVKDMPLKKPKGKQVVVKHEAIGLNFIDINFRRGSYPFKIPGILGCEAAGYIEAVGEEADDFKIGDRVAYATAPNGAYSKKRIIDQRYLVPLPKYVSFTDAAAMLLKGMTAHYLLRRTFFVSDKNIIMTYAASGGVGQILCALGQHYKTTVIAVVSSKEKYNKAKALGTHIVINSEKEDVLASVMSHSLKRGVHVVYDSIGKDTFEMSLKCLSNFGIMVSFGAASGPIPPIDANKLKEKCLFFTATNLFLYKKSREELLLSSNEVFSLMKQKVIVPDIYKKYSFSEIKEAHSDIENRKTMGQCVLIP